MFCPGCGNENGPDARWCTACGRALPTLHPGAAPAPPPARQTYGGFWKRAAALLIDWVLMLAPAFVLGALIGLAVGPGEGAEKTAEHLGNLAGIVVSWLYYALAESSSWQATPGKRMLGMQVTDLEGRRISFGRASGRFFGKIVSGLTLGVGYAMAGFTDRKQGLHDMMAGCLVVNRGPSLAHAGAAARAADRPAALPPQAPRPDRLRLAAAVTGGLLVAAMLLVAISLPRWHDRETLGRVEELAAIGDQATRAVEVYFHRHDAMPEHIAETGLVISSPQVAGVSLNPTSGVVRVVAAFDPVKNKALLFVPSLDEQQRFTWKCAGEDIPAEYLPEACR